MDEISQNPNPLIMAPSFFALDRARNRLVDLVSEIDLTMTEARILGHWLRMGTVEELDALHSLLLKFRHVRP